jgi:outer membrane protein assembly factor BamB
MKTVRPFHGLVLLGFLYLALLVSVSVVAQGTPEEPAGASSGSEGSANWLHFGYDSAYSAYNPLEHTIGVTNVTNLQRVWGIGCDDSWFSVIWRSPAIYKGTLYTSGAGSRLTAYAARTGERLWQFGAGTGSWAPQPVVSEDGTVFYLEETYPTSLYAVDGATGRQLWKAPLDFNLGYSGAAEALVTVDEANDLVYIVELPFVGGGKLFALDKQTGAVVWYKSKETDNATFSGNYVLYREGKIFAAAEVPMEPYPFKGDHMLKIDAASQAIEMTFDRPEPENYYDIEQYTLCNDRLVVGFDYQYDPVKLLVAYDPISSTIAWQRPFSTAITGKIACNTASNQLYVPTDPYLYALDAADGEEVWKYLGYGEIYNPSVANGIVYFLSDTNMYAIDEETGQRLFSYPLGYEAEKSSQVAIWEGMLFFSGNGGTCDLYALGLLDEKLYLPLVLRGQ